MQLVIVESPAKAKSINTFPGSGHEGMARFGHVRDLPPRDGSVDPETGFAMAWEVSAGRAWPLAGIRDGGRGAAQVMLGSGPDRFGAYRI